MSSIQRILAVTALTFAFAESADAQYPRVYSDRFAQNRSYAQRYGLYRHRSYAQRYGLYGRGSYAERNGLYNNLTYAQENGFFPYYSYPERRGLDTYRDTPHRLPYFGLYGTTPNLGGPRYRPVAVPGFGWYGYYGYGYYRYGY